MVAKLLGDKNFFDAVGAFVLSPETAGAFDAMLTPPAGLEKDEPSDPEAEAKAKAADGVFDIRGAIGQKFARSHRPGTPDGDRYLAATTRAEKAKFRAEWAMSVYAGHAKKGKKKSQAWQDINESIGEHKTLGAIVVMFGGWSWPPAVEGAKRLAATCSRLGPPWVIKDSMSGLAMYLVLKTQFKHVLAKSWSMYEDFWEQEAAGGNGGNGGGGTANTATTGGAAASGSGGGGTPRRATAGGAPASAPTPPSAKRGITGGKSSLAKRLKKKDGETPTPPKKDAGDVMLLRDAAKVKAQVVKFRAMGKQLAEAITSGAAEWKRLNNDDNVGLLKTALKTLDDTIEKDAFLSNFLLYDPKSMKEQAGPSFPTKLRSFIALQALIGDVQSETHFLMSTQKAKPTK